MSRHLGGLVCLGLLVAVASAQDSSKVFFLQKNASQWADQLKNGDAAARRNAAFALGKLGKHARLALPALQTTLKQEKDAKACEAMVWAAGEIAGATGSDPDLQATLIAALSHPDKLVRRSAACALGQSGATGPAVRDALAAVLSDKEAVVRQNAAWALGQLDEKAAPALCSALKDGDSLVKRDAANALFAVGRVKPSVMRPALGDLLKMTGDPSSEVRKAGLTPLVWIIEPKDKEAAPILKAVLSDADPEVRRFAAQALARVGGKDAEPAVPILVDAIRSGEAATKRSAAIALGQIGEAAGSAVPDLIKALNDPNPQVRGGAALALGKIGKAAEDAVPALVNILTDKQQALEFRVEAAEALTNMGAIPAIRKRIPQMLTVLGNPNEPGDLRIRTAWLFNEFLVAKQTDAVKSGYDTFAKVCAEPSSKDNGSTRYHCAWLLGIVYQREAPDPALDVLEEWLYDTTGKLYGGKVASSGVSGTEKKSQDNVDAVLEGDSRVMAVQALKFIGKGRVRDRPKIVQQLKALAKDEKTNSELKKDARDLLNLLGQ